MRPTTLWPLVMAALGCAPKAGDCPARDPRCAPVEDVFATPKRVASDVLPARAPELRVEFAGCTSVMGKLGSEVECIYEPGRELRLWVVHDGREDPTIAFEGEGKWRSEEVYTLEGEPGQGHRLRLESEGLEAVVVTLPGGPQWRLRMRELATLNQREWHLREEFYWHSYAVEIRLAKGDVSAVLEADALIQGAAAEGLVSDAVVFGQAASFHTGAAMNRYDLAQWQIERLAPLTERYPAARGGLSIYLGHVLSQRGQLVGAAAMYRSGGRYSLRMDDLGLQLDVLAPYAQLLSKLGYFEASAHWAGVALELTERVRHPIDAGPMLSVIASTGLRLEQEHRIYEDSRPHFKVLEKMYGPGGILEDKELPYPVRFDLAELALLDHDPVTALGHLDLIEHGHPSVDQRVNLLELQLQAQSMITDEIDPLALRETLEELERLTAQTVAPEERWRGAVVRGMLHERLGEFREARAAYEAAEDLVDELVSLEALGMPGDFTAVFRGKGTQRLVTRLVEDDQLAAAACAVRRARSRMSRRALLLRTRYDDSRKELRSSIERYYDQRAVYERQYRNDARNLADPRHERARAAAQERRVELEQQALDILSQSKGYNHQTTCEDLVARQPHELLLVLFPYERGLRVLASDDDGTVHFELESFTDVDPQRLSTQLLGPLRERLAGADQVRVSASGRAAAIAVHALPWRREPGGAAVPLAFEFPVVYSLDLPVANEEPSRSRHTALLLADRSAASATLEVEEIRHSLEEAQWRVQSPMTKRLSITVVRKLLAEVDHLHYAGHAYYADGAMDAPIDAPKGELHWLWPPYSGGAASVPAYIPLGEFGRLTVPDVLMMDRVPRTVVLMGCATGVIDERTGGFSLSTAFLGAGAHAVVASTGEIDGDQAALLGRALYEQISDEAIAHPGRWMSEALKVARDRGLLEHSVADYRVWVP